MYVPHVFRPLQGHHQGGIYNGIKEQQILSNPNVGACTVKYKHNSLIMTLQWSKHVGGIQMNNYC